MTATKQGILRPVSLRQRSAAMAIGVSAVLLSTAASAQSQPAPQGEQEVQLDTLKIEDRTADVSPYSQKGALRRSAQSMRPSCVSWGVSAG